MKRKNKVTDIKTLLMLQKLSGEKLKCPTCGSTMNLVSILETINNLVIMEAYVIDNNVRIDKVIFDIKTSKIKGHYAYNDEKNLSSGIQNLQQNDFI